MLLRYEHDNIEHRIPGISRDEDKAMHEACDTRPDPRAALEGVRLQCRCRAMTGDLFEELSVSAVRTLCEFGVCSPADAEAAEAVGQKIIESMPARIRQYDVDRRNTDNPVPGARSTPAAAARRLSGEAARLARLTPLRQYEKPEWRAAHDEWRASQEPKSPAQ